MFSGLVESVQKIAKVTQGDNSISLWITRPSEFGDLKVGDSISVNGICLTLESFDSEMMKMTMGAETLKVLAQSLTTFLNHPVNLERSLKWGDRVHGHMVTGHVESLAQITRSEAQGDCWILEIKCPDSVKEFILNKGSIALHGVSLTVNEIRQNQIQVCLIPETIKKTNLSLFRAGDYINLESDYAIKSLLKTFENKELLKRISEQIGLNEGKSL